jgi:nucleoside-diphosphate-sugar epimerase
MNKLLITGSNGFIGTYLLEKLGKHFDIYSLISDLRDHEGVRKEVHTVKPDLVIHLAARTEVERSFYEQTTFSDINYTGTVNLVESIVELEKQPRLLFASTMEVYGWQPISDDIKNGKQIDVIPVFDTETTIPNPNAPYSVAKYACEKYIEYAHRCRGLQYVNIRQTNAYGRKDNTFFVTEQIITQMLTNSDECKLGYKMPYRNFIFIEDLLDAWVTVIEKFDTIANDVYNLGPNNPIQIVAYADLIASKLDWKGNIIWDTKPARPGEIYLLNSSEEKLSRLTGWKPKYTLSEGVDKTIEIWKEKLNK